MTKERRKNKRFGLNNVLVLFPEKSGMVGQIENISEGGIQIASEMEFKEGDVTPISFYLWKVSEKSLGHESLELKIKIIWKKPSSNIEYLKYVYGVSFLGIDKRGEKLIYSLLESLDEQKKASDKNIEKVVLDLDAYLSKNQKAC